MNVYLEKRKNLGKAKKKNECLIYAFQLFKINLKGKKLKFKKI